MPTRLIGPRRQTGSFYKKRPTVKKPRARGGKPLTQAIQKVINRNLETKYVFSGVPDTQLFNTLRAKQVAGSANNLLVAVPSIANTGTATNDLIGARAKIVSHQTKIHINFGAANAVSQDVYVRVFFLQSRNAKSFTVTGSLPGKNLLRNGQGAEQDWVPGSGLDPRIFAQLPINKLAWTGTSKTFRLSKNGGTLNGQAVGSVPVLRGSSSFSITHNWKAAGKVIKYDEADGSAYPENYCPFVGFVAWYPDGTPVGDPDSAMPVYIQMSHHMYFKDA
jgi:hypothetical protein